MKIMIVGCGGTGKTRLSKKLHELIGLRLIHLDQFYWKSNWEETAKDEWTEIVVELSNESEWIMDGNYKSTMDLRMRKADQIIYLDSSRWTCIYRVLARAVKTYGTTRSDMAKGCKERFNWNFLKYIFQFNSKNRTMILEKLRQYKAQGKEVLILSNSQQRQDYLLEMKRRFTKSYQ